MKLIQKFIIKRVTLIYKTNSCRSTIICNMNFIFKEQMYFHELQSDRQQMLKL